MKKQTKSQKSKKTVVATPVKRVVVVHTRRQRIIGFIALALLFACGLFVGLAIQTNVYVHKHLPIAGEPIANVESVEPSEYTDVCDEVERLLLRRMPAESDNIDERIERAKIYVSLAERGCIDNSDAYAELARQELEIARAIDNDNFSHDETIEVVETYKRLHMQEAAEEIFDKARKLTDPTIDFIIQVQKIINE